MIKNLTYHNLMIVIHKLMKKGYTMAEAELIAKGIFAAYYPGGMSIEQRVNQVLSKDKYTKMYKEATI